MWNARIPQGYFGSGKPIFDRLLKARIDRDARCESLSDLIITSEWSMLNGEECRPSSRSPHYSISVDDVLVVGAVSRVAFG